jgi:ERCC4-type nuclease
MIKKPKQEEYPSDFIIEVDTREQLPFFLSNPPKGLTITRITLSEGDYSIRGFEKDIIIERKNILDFLGSISNRREEFKAELKRMKEKNILFRFIIVEGTLEEVASSCIIGSNPKGKKENTVKPFVHRVVQINWNAVFGSIISLTLRYNIHFIFAKNRSEAEKFCLALLLKFYKLKRNNEI